jgi:hypothetical protein
MLKKCYKVIMLRSKWLWAGAVCVAIAAALLGGGCGGDDSGSSAAPGDGVVAEGEKGEGGNDAGGGGEEGGGSAAEDPGGAVGGVAPNGSAPSGGAAGGGGGSNGGGGKGGQTKSGLGEKAARGGRGGSKKRVGKGGSNPAGGGGADGDDAKAAFLTEADAICRAERKDIRQNLSKYTGEGLNSLTKNAPAIVNELVIPNLEDEMRGIEALNPPASARDAMTALFGAIDGLIARARAEPRNFILDAESVEKSIQVAEANGFKVCGGI